MPVVIIPLLATLIAGGLMVMVLGRPLARRSRRACTDWLNGLTGTSAILLGIILGLMMCFDLGGPVNKAAYAFATAGPRPRHDQPRPLLHHGRRHGRRHGAAAGDGAGHRRSARSSSAGRAGERQGGLAARRVVHLRGRDPVRRGRPAAGHPVDDARRRRHRRAHHGRRRDLRAPHGGIFVFFAIGNFLLWLLAIVIGAVVGGICVVIAKSAGGKASHGDAKVEDDSQTGAAVTSGAVA